MKEFEEKPKNSAKHGAEPLVLKPYLTVNIEEAEEDLRNRYSGEWMLTAFPVQPDGNILLLFEGEAIEETAPDGTERQRIPYCVIAPAPKRQAAKFVRFDLLDSYTATAFLREDGLYAVTSKEGETKYRAVRVWSTEEGKSWFNLCRDINSLTLRDNGDVVTSCTEEAVKRGAPMVSMFTTDRQKLDFAGLGDGEKHFLRDVTMDSCDRIWGVMEDRRTVVVLDADGSTVRFRLPVKGVVSLAVPEDNGAVYAACMTGNRKYGLFRCTAAEKRPCRLLNGIDRFDEVSCGRHFAAVRCGEELYVSDLSRTERSV